MIIFSQFSVRFACFFGQTVCFPVEYEQKLKNKNKLCLPRQMSTEVMSVVNINLKFVKLKYRISMDMSKSTVLVEQCNMIFSSES